MADKPPSSGYQVLTSPSETERALRQSGMSEIDIQRMMPRIRRSFLISNILMFLIALLLGSLAFAIGLRLYRALRTLRSTLT